MQNEGESGVHCPARDGRADQSQPRHAPAVGKGTEVQGVTIGGLAGTVAWESSRQMTELVISSSDILVMPSNENPRFIEDQVEVFTVW